MAKKTYEMCGETEYKLLRSVIEKHHPTLNEGMVSFSLMLVFAAKDDDGNPKGAALTERGKPADYTVKVTPVEMRVRGMADVMVSIDGDRWGDKSEDEQTAIFDRLCESMFVEIGEDEKRTVKSDAADRPIISRREPDLVVVGYSAVMKRNGRFSPEHDVIEEFTTAMKQADLPLADIAKSATAKPAKPETKRKRGASAKTKAAREAAVEAMTEEILGDITAQSSSVEDTDDGGGEGDEPETEYDAPTNVAPIRRPATRAMFDAGAPS